MVAFKQGRGAFADALIAELGTRAGCIYTLTFDEKTLGLPSFYEVVIGANPVEAHNEN